MWINYVALESDGTINLKGFPQNAYGYGVLITIFSGQAFRNIQLYIPHSDRSNSNRPVYFRTLADGSSDKGDGTCWRVTQVTTIETY